MITKLKNIGILSETKVLAALVEKDLTVSIPYGDNARYDFVVEFEPGVLSRVQVKTAHLTSGVVNAKLYSTNATSSKHEKYTTSQIDFFMIYCLELDKVYILPVKDFSGYMANLRIVPTKNNQQSKVKWAVDYEF